MTRRAGIGGLVCCRDERGFSVIELVIVAAIIAVVAAVAAPRFGNSLAKCRVEAAAKRIVADLALAQRQAKVSSARKTVIFDVANNEYVLAGLRNLDRSSNTYRVNLSAVPYESKVVAVDLGGDAVIAFDGYGMPDSGGTIAVQAGRVQKVVVVDAATGRASVQAGPVGS